MVSSSVCVFVGGCSAVEVVEQQQQEEEEVDRGCAAVHVSSSSVSSVLGL